MFVGRRPTSMNSMHSMTGFWAVAGHTPYSCTMLAWYPRLNILSWSAMMRRSAAASTCDGNAEQTSSGHVKDPSLWPAHSVVKLDYALSWLVG